MTGHWVSPVEHDRTRPIMKFCVWNLLEMTGRWGPVSDHFLTDASGHQLTVEIGRSAFEVGDTWRRFEDRTLGSCVRSIRPTRPVIPHCA